jgi:FkbM family methyltransferase
MWRAATLLGTAMMTVLRKTLLYHILRGLRTGIRRRIVLPHLEEIELAGVRLKVSGLSTSMKEALLNGTYEEAELSLCRQLLVPGDVVLEVGSAIGFLGIFATQSIGVGRFVSVEANTYTAERLRKNYELNGAPHELHVAALSDTDGPVTLHASENFWTDTIVPPVLPVPSLRTISVPGYTLATLCANSGCAPTALIIDVEGAETCLLSQSIPQSVKKMVLELHPHLTGTTQSFQILHHIMNQHFKVAGTAVTSFALIRD